jgi:beta-N-acetylhexosaminidase
MVMLSVATYPAFSDKPAALSRSLATQELRGRLGFRGVSITDSLDSAAARATGNSGDIAIAGARAGSDLLLFGNYDHAASASRALRRALHRGRLRRGDFRASVRRELRLRADLH